MRIHCSISLQWQIINHLLNYPGEANGLYMTLTKTQQDDVYEILNQILWIII